MESNFNRKMSEQNEIALKTCQNFLTFSKKGNKKKVSNKEERNTWHKENSNKNTVKPKIQSLVNCQMK